LLLSIPKRRRNSAFSALSCSISAKSCLISVF
jgi:hypothetical protein